jgi:hypothetical protein
MPNGTYRFEMADSVNLDGAELTLGLAILAAEGLFGGASVRMDAGYRRLDGERVFLVDGSTDVGAAVVRVFTTFLAREFGGESFKVGRGTGTKTTAESERPAAA